MNNLLKERGNDWCNVELKGWLQQETNHTADAAKTYEGLLKLIPKDESLAKDEKAELVADVHYILSGVYVELDKIDTAAEHLQLLLKQHPDEPKYNNDLGYIWADHDMHLDEAERMIRKALTRIGNSAKALAKWTQKTTRTTLPTSTAWDGCFSRRRSMRRPSLTSKKRSRTRTASRSRSSIISPKSASARPNCRGCRRMEKGDRGDCHYSPRKGEEGRDSKEARRDEVVRRLPLH